MDKLTDSEIVKALECCCGGLTSDWCDKCPMNITKKCDKDLLALEKLALDLITRLQAENERLRTKCGKLKKDKYKLQKALNQSEDYRVIAKAKAYKEFAERLKKEATADDNSTWWIANIDVDNILKELVGEDNEN